MSVPLSAALCATCVLGMVTALKYRRSNKSYLLLAAVCAVLALLSGAYVVLGLFFVEQQ